MKIRNGFVSNSSSSSFVVAFEKIPQTWEELHSMMFDKEMTIGSYGDFLDSKQIAQAVFRDMQPGEYSYYKLRYGRQTSIANAIRIAQSEYGNDIEGNEIDRSIHDLNNKIVTIVEEVIRGGEATNNIQQKIEPLLVERKMLIAKLDEDVLGGADIYYEGNDFKKNYKGKHLFVFSYSDDCNSVMEQGDIFKKLPHLVFNHH